MRRDTPAVALAGLLFFLSGAAALVYQVAWQRLLALHSGVGLYSVAMIVAAFMAGLGIGSLLGGRFSTRLGGGRALAAFAALEIGISAFGAASTWLYYDWLYPRAVHLPSPSWQAGLLHLVVLLPPTVLMGMSLPFLVRAVVTEVEGAGRRIGWLYGVNVLGAAAGASRDALGSAARSSDVRGAVLAAAAANFSVGARRARPLGPAPAVVAGAGRGDGGRGSSRRGGAGEPAAPALAVALRALGLRGSLARDRLVPPARRRREIHGVHLRHRARLLPARLGGGLAPGGAARRAGEAPAAGLPPRPVRDPRARRRAGAPRGDASARHAPLLLVRRVLGGLRLLPAGARRRPDEHRPPLRAAATRALLRPHRPHGRSRSRSSSARSRTIP